MKAYYYENNGYNGILLVGKDGKWISYDEVIDGIEINRENMDKIACNLAEYGYDDNDFQTAYDQATGTLMYGENAQAALDEQDYYEPIYDSIDALADRVWEIQHGE